MSEPRAPRPRTSSGTRLVLALVLSLVVGSVSTVAALAAVVYHSGTVDVEVFQQDGEHVSISVPSTLVTAAVKLVPGRVFADAADEIGPYWPACRAACRELVRAPDGVYVSVTGPDVEVRVAKEDDRLRIDVQDGGDRVHVSVPVKSVLALVDKLAPA